MGKASNLVPLLVLFVLIAIAAFVGFIAYSVANDVSDKAAKRMEKKNIKFTKGGMQVGVKQISTEDISDSTQSYVYPMLSVSGDDSWLCCRSDLLADLAHSTLMKVWNSASWPGYKSKLRWGQNTGESGQSTPTGSGTSTGTRKP